VADFSFTTVCENTPPTDFTDLSVGNSGNIVSWYWSFGNNTSVIQNPSNDFITSGTYSVTLAITNGVGCVDTITKMVLVNAVPVANFGFNPDSAFAPVNVGFIDSSSNTVVDWFWDFGDNNSSTIQNPHNYYPEVGDYTVILTVTDSNGCITSDTALVVVLQDKDILVPNVFSPNGDGINDVFMVKSKYLQVLKGAVFNRWGELLFEWDNPQGYWDGRTLAGKEVPAGTYFYVIHYETLENVKQTVKGTVTLFK